MIPYIIYSKGVCNFNISDDESRVVLDELPGLKGSDYINASWINVNINASSKYIYIYCIMCMIMQGYKHQNAYIAAQGIYITLLFIITCIISSMVILSGPKPSTIEDMWRMIWQYNISHIVMLTGVYEGGRVST